VGGKEQIDMHVLAKMLFSWNACEFDVLIVILLLCTRPCYGLEFVCVCVCVCRNLMSGLLSHGFVSRLMFNILFLNSFKTYLCLLLLLLLLHLLWNVGHGFKVSFLILTY